MPARLIHVVAAVIYDQEKRKVLLAKRPIDKHQGGKWEFPGGKVETGEEVLSALQRELYEEIGIHPSSARPLIKIPHHYPDKSVLLDVWEVFDFTGKPHGREGQAIEWVTKEQLSSMEFPAANTPILTAIALANFCLITPAPADATQFQNQLAKTLKKGIELVLFRAKTLSTKDYVAHATRTIEQAHSAGARVILNSPPQDDLLALADGLHLTRRQLMSLSHRPDLANTQTLSASCHSLEELRRAEAINADFALLSPVNATLSHPGTLALGWQRFKEYTDQIQLPVYALGGLGADDFLTARENGAQGIAGISQFWNDRYE